MLQLGLLAGPAGHHLVEYAAERRVQIAFSASSEELQKLLPKPWRSASMPSGPSGGANLMLVFRNRLLAIQYNADGVVRGAPDHGAIVLAFASNPVTGESGFRVIHALAANPESIPGAYQNSKLASVAMEQVTSVQEGTGRLCTEDWQLKDSGGGTLDLHLRYRAGTPSQSSGDMKMFGGPDPDFFRIYRFDRGTDFIMGVSMATDRVDELRFSSTLPELLAVFDGSERLISISADPWYLRQVWLPNDR